MRKLKKVKSNIAVKAHYIEADGKQMLYAGVNMLMACTIDYFDDQDTAFCDEYLKTVNWAYGFIEKFKEKLKASKKKEFIFDIAMKKYTTVLGTAAHYTKNDLGFNLDNEREKADKKYYDFLNLSIVIMENIVNKLTVHMDLWIKKYFKMIKIQIRSIMKIFEEEMKSI